MTAAQVANFCGVLNQNLKVIEHYYSVNLSISDGYLIVISDRKILENVIKAIKLAVNNSMHEALSVEVLQNILSAADKPNTDKFERFTIRLKKKSIRPKSELQCRYIDNIAKKIINFGVGPAGTGKTYLAVAMAVQALQNETVSRLILTRPAVEAGEKLGFLPGDLAQKVDPYLRPVYDALYEMLGFDKVEKLIARHVIEVAPLAYMRGRTLNNAFVILDEAQNTTRTQMKMFLTRIGFGSKAVITGDITQTDLPNGQYSGLQHSFDLLRRINEIGFIYFNSDDVVRHPLVQSIVEAYDGAENSAN